MALAFIADVAIASVTVSGVLLVALLYAFYSFHAPAWVLPGAVAVPVVLALASSVRRRQVPGTGLIPVWAPSLVISPLFVGLLTGPPSPGDAAPPAVAADTRVMTYNIRQGFGASGRFDLEAVAREIEARPSDVVALQEVGRGWVVSGAVDTLAWLSHRLDVPAYFGANLGDLWGSAVLTRLPVLKASNTRVTIAGRVPRGIQHVELQTTGAPITILHAHLDHEADCDTVRAIQVARMLEDWAKAPRTILLGDLNVRLDSAAIRILLDAGFVDASPDGPLTYPAAAPAVRIDYVFATPDLAVSEAETRPSLASDHRPVWASLTGP